MIYLDTHVVVKFNDGHNRVIPNRVQRLVNQNDVLISPIVALELDYMFEIGRITQRAQVVIARLNQLIGLQVCDEPFADVIVSAAQHSWTRDPFDRIIVGHAALRQRPLITEDRMIHRHYPYAFWSDGV